MSSPFPDEFLQRLLKLGQHCADPVVPGDNGWECTPDIVNNFVEMIVGQTTGCRPLLQTRAVERCPPQSSGSGAGENSARGAG